MRKIQHKLILRKIAKRWAKGILQATAMDSVLADEILSADEQAYIVEEVNKIANRITSDGSNYSLESIIEDYFEIETI